MFTYEAFQILMFLIPGFISAKIYAALVYSRNKGDQERITDSLIFAMFIYAIYYQVTGIPPVSYTAENGIFNYNTFSLLFLTGLSVILPLLFSMLSIKEWHMEILRKLHITRNTTRPSTWLDIFYDKGKSFITITFTDGNMLYGYPDYFSDDPINRFVYLTGASWIDDKDNYIKIPGDGILITPEMKIETIMFHRPVKNKETILCRLISFFKKKK